MGRHLDKRSETNPPAAMRAGAVLDARPARRSDCTAQTMHSRHVMDAPAVAGENWHAEATRGVTLASQGNAACAKENPNKNAAGGTFLYANEPKRPTLPRWALLVKSRVKCPPPR